MTLLRVKLAPGERVAILARNVPEYVHALYAAPAAGAVLVLLNYRLHWREWAAILQETDARVLLVHAELLDAVVPALDDLPALRRVVVIDEVDGPPDLGTLPQAVKFRTWIDQPRTATGTTPA